MNAQENYIFFSNIYQQQTMNRSISSFVPEKNEWNEINWTTKENT